MLSKGIFVIFKVASLHSVDLNTFLHCTMAVFLASLFQGQCIWQFNVQFGHAI